MASLVEAVQVEGNMSSGLVAIVQSDLPLAPYVTYGNLRPYPWLLVALSFVIVVGVLTLRKSGLKQDIEPLPRLPGLPYIGRLWDVPASGATVDLARHFNRFHAQYGPMYEWMAMGVVRVMIGDQEIVDDLFVKHGKEYADKPEFTATVGMKHGQFLPLMGVSEEQARHRNFIMSMMNISRRQGFYGHTKVEAGYTLRRMLTQRSDEWSQNIIIHCARSASLCAWGTAELSDTLIEITPPLLKFLSPAGPLPNKLPFLARLPTILSPWKQREAIRRSMTDQVFLDTFALATEQVEQGIENSWTRLWHESRHDSRSPSSKLSKQEAAHAIGTCAFVAIATIGSPLHAFFTAMAHHPSWLTRLQAEIDEVCGDHRFPEIEDLKRLPVLRAVVREVFRWRPPIPLGMPHIINQDHIYKGQRIREGSIIVANQLALSRNETLYPHPEEFRPERWLEPSWPSYREPLTKYPDIRGDPAFGWGARACPGLELTRAEVYTVVGGIAWAFDMKRKEGKEGLAVPWWQTNPWIITTVHSFPLDITPRNEKRERFLRALDVSGDQTSRFAGEKFGSWQGCVLPTQIPA